MEANKIILTQDENKVYHINLNTFVVPNPGCHIEDLFNNDAPKAYEKIYELNKLDSSDKRLIELWMVCEEHRCDNVGDHGMKIEVESGYVYLSGFRFSYLPYQVLAKYEEGNTFEYIVEFPVFKDENEYDESCSTESIKLNMHVTCSQANYRYARFGSFERVVDKCKPSK